MAPVVPVLGLVLLYFGPGQTPKTSPTQAPPISSAPVATQGKLERQSVRYYVRLHQPAVRYCYVQELGRRRDLKVEVTVEFTVRPDGSVSGCSAGTTPIGECVAKAVCRIRFPAIFDELKDGSLAPSKQSTQIRYRFRFQPPPKPGTQRGQPSDPIARDRAADDADDPPPSATSPTPPGTTTPPPAVRRPEKPAAAAKGKPGLLRRPSTDDPLDGIDKAGDQL